MIENSYDGFPTQYAYKPCFECFNRYHRTFTDDCYATCEFAHSIKCRDMYIESLKSHIEKLESNLQEEKSRVAKLIARNSKLDYDLGNAYQTITKLTGE